MKYRTLRKKKEKKGAESGTKNLNKNEKGKLKEIVFLFMKKVVLIFEVLNFLTSHPREWLFSYEKKFIRANIMFA